MSSFGTVTTIERTDKVGPGTQSPGLVFRATRIRRLPGASLTRLFGQAHASNTELQVDVQGLATVGDLGGSRQGSLKLPWSRISELHYAPGGAGEIGGLYAREGPWCSRCILPCITEAQAEEVIAVIAGYYPGVACPENKRQEPRVVGVPYRPAPPSSWSPQWSAAIPPPR